MWKKKGLLLNVNGFIDTSLNSHASIPFAFHLKNDEYLIFFSSRDKQGRSLPYSIKAKIVNDEIELSKEIVGPLFNLGPLGSFDDSGIMPSSVIQNGKEIWMYYIGWNPQVTVSYRLSIGLAISLDNGKTFTRASNGPLLDRSFFEPYFNTAPFVFKDNGLWRMFYVSCTGWIDNGGKKEPLYLVRQSISDDGISWSKPGKIVVDYTEQAECIGRPCVLKIGDMYEIYFSHRMARNYREDQNMSYKIGSAISFNADEWFNFNFDIFKGPEKGKYINN